MSKTSQNNPTRRQQTLLERLDAECPPFFAYAMARNKPHGGWIGVGELCKRAGLTRRTVIRIGSKISWQGVKLEVASRFLKGCGIGMCGWNLLYMNRERSYLNWQHKSRKRPYNHLTDQQWKNYNKKCQEWLATLEPSRPS